MSWVCIPSTCLPVLEEESLPISCLDTLQSELLSTKVIPEKFCSKDNLTEFFRPFQFGMMLRRSEKTTLSAGNTLIDSESSETTCVSQVDSPARTSVVPGKESVSPEREVDYGARCGELLARYDQDTSMWKTPQCSLFGDSTLSPEDWPKSGMIAGGTLYQLLMPELTTKEKGYGSEEQGYQQIDMWPTPRASEAAEKSLPPSRVNDPGKCTLSQAMHHPKWPTPRAEGGVSRKPGTGGKCLQEEARNASGINVGSLNPDWVELLMGWIKGFTSLEPIDYIEYTLWRYQYGFTNSGAQGVSKDVQTNCMCCMWYDREASASPQGHEFVQQLPRQCGDIMRHVPHEDSSETRDKANATTCNMCSMWESLSSEKEVQVKSMLKNLSFDKWKEQRSETVEWKEDNKNMCTLWQRVSFQEQGDKNMLQELWKSLVMGKKAWEGDWELGVPRVVTGCQNRAHRLKAIGNGQCPHSAVLAWRILGKI